MTRSGFTVWLTGLPSAGKSTIAAECAKRLAEGQLPVRVLDGDEVRQQLCPDLGFSAEDRHVSVQRIGYVASLLAASGVVVLAAVIAPYRRSRDAVRELHVERGVPYLEVHVATPVDVCAARDVKGLYARAHRGELKGLTGIDDPYEPPVLPALRVQTTDREIAASVNEVLALIYATYQAV